MMALDKLVDSSQLDSDLTSVANAIRAKSGGSSQLAFPAGFVSEISNIPSGGQSNFELIGTKVFSNLSEYTDTRTEESLDTQINISNTDYAFGYVVVTCDSQVDSSTTWGMTFQTFGRYTNGNMNAGQATQQRGTATLSKAAISSNEVNTNSYGVYLKNNVGNVVIIRKAYDTTITKIRAGNYTVKVYGMVETSGGGGAVMSATGTFTMAADGTPPILTHNLGTQKIAVVIYPISKVTASGGYKNFYCEYINTAAFFEGDTWTFDWTSYNSRFSGDETVTFPNDNLRVGAIHASPWNTQNSWYAAGNPIQLNPGATRIAITDDTVQIKGAGANLQWASGTYRWIVWKLG